MSEFKPGDVALVECSDGEWRQAQCEPNPDMRDFLVWRFPDRAYRFVRDSAARPLVVIDPEDREQVERLMDAFGAASSPATPWIDQMQAALREYANPTPAKPDEPLGLGAVVEDTDGNRWVRFGNTTRTFHWATDGRGVETWNRINAVRVLSPGYVPEEES